MISPSKVIRFDVITLFPELFPGPLAVGVMGRAILNHLFSIHVHNPRDFTRDKHRTVDDTPYGGGPGMIMKPEPLVACIESLGNPAPLRVLLSPQGIPFTQRCAEFLIDRYSHIALICGRYEGIDERVRECSVDMDLSIGDFILTGGELAAMVVMECMARLIPGVVGDAESVSSDSFSDNLLKYPQYTRPLEFRGMKVPDVLISGNHARIDQWRKEQSLLRTQTRRPDLFSCKMKDENAM